MGIYHKLLLNRTNLYKELEIKQRYYLAYELNINANKLGYIIRLLKTYDKLLQQAMPEYKLENSIEDTLHLQGDITKYNKREVIVTNKELVLSEVERTSQIHVAKYLQINPMELSHYIPMLKAMVDYEQGQSNDTNN